MKRLYKEQWFWLMLCFVALLLIAIAFMYHTKFPLLQLLKSLDCQTIISIIGIVLATLISLYSHMKIINRDLKINTIEHLSKIRAEFPNLSSANMANCSAEKLEEKRAQYLKRMEFFCLGINEGAFSIEIATKMSGHLLVKQFNNYMKSFVDDHRTNGYEYRNYDIVMERMSELLNETKYKKALKLEEAF